MANEFKATQTKLRRGKILRILNTAAPYSVADANDLYRMLQDVGEGLTIFEVHELLRDLKQRGYIAFEQKRDAEQELPLVRWIRLQPAGRDVFEGTRSDPAVALT